MYLAQILFVAVCYTAAGKVGLSVDAVSGFASLIWAPTGIALASLLIGGPGLWPGVFLGALTVNLWNSAPVGVAFGIAVGNALEAIAGVSLVKLIPGFRVTLDRVVDVLAFILLGAIFASLVSASIGVLSLEAGGFVAPGAASETWRAWWIGDVIGALLVAPAILVWAASSRGGAHAKRVAEAAALGGIVVFTSVVVFFFTHASDRNPLAQPFMFYPLLIWAAIRFGKRGAVTAVGIVSLIAIWGTATGHGPFTRDSVHSSLFALQTFMGITSGTFLILGASVSERRRAEVSLRKAHDIATEANRAKAEFLAVMSHELRTPLNAISGYAELMMLGLADPLTDKQRDAVTRIRTSQQHLLGLIDDVLSFAKMEAGRSEIVPRPVNLQETIAALEPMLRPELDRKKLEYICDPCDTSLRLLADPPKLRQILLNILGNAVKFTPESGTIRLAVERKQEEVLITISDTGIGIPPDKLEEIFEPFFQVERGTTRRYEGVGLGLAISRDLARTMGGDIRIESLLGEGTTVVLSLPAAT